MRRVKATALMGAAVAGTVLAGCASNGFVGTWVARDQTARTPFQVGAVTFAPDNTYTAAVEYQGQTMGEPGMWEVDGDTLRLTESNRVYTYEFEDDTLILTSPEGITETLRRYE